MRDLKILDGGSGFEAIQLCKGKIDISNHACWSARLLHDDQLLVREIYKRFLSAGAEVITSLSYQASPITLSSSFNVSIEDAKQLMVDSVLLAKDEILRYQNSRVERVAYNVILNAASIGSYGAHLADLSEYSGSYVDKVSKFDIRNYYEQQISTLLIGEPDILAFETIPSMLDVELIIDLMKENPNTSAWISMISSDGIHTAHGELLDDVIEYINRYSTNNIIGFGLNCVIPVMLVKETVFRIRSRLNPNKIIILYPNNGEVLNNLDHQWDFPQGVTENTFYEKIPSWIEAGAQWIGGCCRMGADRMTRVSDIIQCYRNDMFCD